jgi:hypothetical protein
MINPQLFQRLRILENGYFEGVSPMTLIEVIVTGLWYSQRTWGAE